MSQQKYDIIWQPRALSDLYTIIDYIAEDNPYRAESFLEEIRDQVQLLRGHPKMGRVGQVAGVRELVVHQNYIVYYRFSEGVVQIIRVKHAAQDWV
jgi:toxin ParE1/3/4